MIEQTIQVDRIEDVISVFGSFDQNVRLIEDALGVTVTRCGLRAMCIAEKRLYLLRHLCMVEEALAAAAA